MDEIAVARIARVMIDVDPELGLADGGEDVVAEAMAGRGVERDDHIEIFGFVRRQAHELAAGEEGKLLDQAFLVPDFYFFPELLERETDRDLAPERVAIRAHVAEDDEALVFAQSRGDLGERGVRLVGLS